MCKEVKKSSLYNRHIYLFTSCTMYMLFKKWPGRKWLKSTWVMCDAVVWSVLLSAFPVAVAVTLAASVAVSRAVASTPASLCGPPQKIIYIPLILKYQKKLPWMIANKILTLQLWNHFSTVWIKPLLMSLSSIGEKGLVLFRLHNDNSYLIRTDLLSALEREIVAMPKSGEAIMYSLESRCW